MGVLSAGIFVRFVCVWCLRRPEEDNTSPRMKITR